MGLINGNSPLCFSFLHESFIGSLEKQALVVTQKVSVVKKFGRALSRIKVEQLLIIKDEKQLNGNLRKSPELPSNECNYKFRNVD